MQNNRSVILDGFRGFGSLLIILYHLTTRYEQMISGVNEWPFSLNWGWMAWSVFFVLTGYLVQPKNETIRDFVWGKVIRLFPGYWAAMTVCFIVTHLALPEMAVSLNDFLIDLTMLGNYLGRASVVGVDWTLSINLIYYAFIVLVMILGKLTAKDSLFENLAIAWSIIACILSVMQNRGVEHPIIKIIGILIAANYAHMFLSGILLRRISQKETGRQKYFLLLILVILEQWLVFHNPGFSLFFTVFLLLFLSCILRRVDSLQERGWIKVIRPLVFIANISYPLYLVHEYLGFAIIKGCESAGFLNEVVLIPVIAAVIFVAWAINRFVERPVAKALKKIQLQS